MPRAAVREPECRRIRRAALLSARIDADLRFDVWRCDRDGAWTMVWGLGARRSRASSFAAELTRKYGELHVAVPAGRHPLLRSTEPASTV